MQICVLDRHKLLVLRITQGMPRMQESHLGLTMTHVLIKRIQPARAKREAQRGVEGGGHVKTSQ